MAAVDLYWLPLGAGGRFVRLNGRVYEALAARMGRRPARDLYHCALRVEVPEGMFVVEQAPVRDGRGARRGVVAEGAVGARWAGRLRVFRYEVRRWLDGCIPDVAEAVDSPRRLSSDEDLARHVLDLVAQVPTPVWGRDELGTGEMWNSNSVIAWTLARSGIDAGSIRPPERGRAPGWRAGLEVARRQVDEGATSGRPLGRGPKALRRGRRLGVAGAALGIVAGAVQWAFGSEIPGWTGDKLHPERLGLITIALSALALAAVRAAARSPGLPPPRRWLVGGAGILVPAAICFTTVGPLWYLPGALLLAAGALLVLAPRGGTLRRSRPSDGGWR